MAFAYTSAGMAASVGAPVLRLAISRILPFDGCPSLQCHLRKFLSCLLSCATLATPASCCISAARSSTVACPGMSGALSVSSELGVTESLRLREDQKRLSLSIILDTCVLVSTVERVATGGAHTKS